MKKELEMAITTGRRLLSSIVLLSLVTFTALGKQNLSDWKKVEKKIGSPVAVITKTGKRLEGKLIAATDDSLKIEDQGQTQEVMKPDIAEVRIKQKARGRKAGWIGGLSAAGCAIGVAIGKATNPFDDAGWGMFGPWIGGAIGAAGGAVIGAVMSGTTGKYVKEETIYRTP
jgi:small nuclear ribonucleoprotein (snRNP)-like protein